MIWNMFTSSFSQVMMCDGWWVLRVVFVKIVWGSRGAIHLIYCLPVSVFVDMFCVFCLLLSRGCVPSQVLLFKCVMKNCSIGGWTILFPFPPRQHKTHHKSPRQNLWKTNTTPLRTKKTKQRIQKTAEMQKKTWRSEAPSLPASGSKICTFASKALQSNGRTWSSVARKVEDPTLFFLVIKDLVGQFVLKDCGNL